MVNLAEWDSLAVEMGKLGKRGRLPKNAPIQKVVDELQRSVDTMRGVVHQLLRHNRIGPDWNAQAAPDSQRLFVTLRWNGVGPVTLNGITYSRAFLVYHNKGFVMTNYVEVRKTIESSTADPLMGGFYRIAAESKDYVLLQVTQPFVNNRIVVDLIFWRGLEIPASRENESSTAFSGFQQQGPVEPEIDSGPVTGATPQPPAPPDPTEDIDLGTKLRYSGSFTITSSGLTAGQPMFVYEVPDAVFPDGSEMDRITCAAIATSATQIAVYWISHPGPVSGTRRFAFMVGE